MDTLKKQTVINPFKLSQPMGAALAFLGVRKCMPLMHGVQGCASFAREFFSCHFNKPIMIHTTSVNDISAVLDGGSLGIRSAVDNITEKKVPELIGLFSTGLTETKGDDLKSAASTLEIPCVYVNTPDFEGSLQSGWALVVEALLEQQSEKKESCKKGKILLLPHVSIGVVELERIKEFVSDFGFDEVLALPDISTSFDVLEGKKDEFMSSGGISLGEIREIADCDVALAFGESMEKSLSMLHSKNPNIKTALIPSLGGLRANDYFVETLIGFGYTAGEKVKRWRKRLQETLLDTHFTIGNARYLIALESDHALSIANIIEETGAKLQYIITPHKSNIQNHLENTISVGDMIDTMEKTSEVDILITNEHLSQSIKEQGKIFIPRGFPIFRSMGNMYKCDILYEGSSAFLYECSNALES